MAEHYYVSLGIQSRQPIGHALIEPLPARSDQIFYKPIAGLRPETGPAAVIDNDIPSGNRKSQIYR